MHEIWQSVVTYIAAHPAHFLLIVIGFFVGWWIFSGIVSALPAPDGLWPDPATRHGRYWWYWSVYTCGHTLSGSLGRVFEFVRLNILGKWLGPPKP